MLHEILQDEKNYALVVNHEATEYLKVSFITFSLDFKFIFTVGEIKFSKLDI